MSTESRSNNVWLIIGALIVGDALVALWFLWPSDKDKKKPQARPAVRQQKTSGSQGRKPATRKPAGRTPAVRRKAPMQAPKATPKKSTKKGSKTSSLLDLPLPTNARRVGRLPSGEVVYAIPQGGNPVGKHKIHERPRGSKLYARTKSGKLRPLLPSVLVAEARIAAGSGRVAAVTPGTTLVLSAPNGREPVQTVAKGVDYFPSFDARGKRLAYSRKTTIDQHFLTLYSLEEKRKKTLTKGHSGFSSPVFSPDGRSMIYVSGDSGVASLWKVDLQTQRKVQLTNRGQGNQGGLPPNFVSPPMQGRILWAGRWIVYDSGGTLWGLLEDGTNVRKLAVKVRSFRWKKPGQSVEIKGTSGRTRTIVYPGR